MQLGVVFPQTEIGSDPGGVRAYAQAAQDMGFRHLLAYDHVLGADPTERPGLARLHPREHVPRGVRAVRLPAPPPPRAWSSRRAS